MPLDASEDPVRFKETQFVNDPNSDTMIGVPVSPGTITAPASLINSPAEFDQMRPGSILVCPDGQSRLDAALRARLGARHGHGRQ